LEFSPTPPTYATGSVLSSQQLDRDVGYRSPSRSSRCVLVSARCRSLIG
jgi:hypothetical protein